MSKSVSGQLKKKGPRAQDRPQTGVETLLLPEKQGKRERMDAGADTCIAGHRGTFSLMFIFSHDLRSEPRG